MARFLFAVFLIVSFSFPASAEDAQPSPAMEAYFLRHFLTLATAKNYDYYIMEAFDQPWKAEQEGAVGSFWGMFNAEGGPKFSFTGPLSSFDQWARYGTAAAVFYDVEHQFCSCDYRCRARRVGGSRREVQI